MSELIRPCLPPLPPALRTSGAKVLPTGACDTHSHVFGPPDRFPLHPGRGYTPHIVSIEDYLRVMDTYGIARAVLVQPSVYGFDNGALLDALSRAPGRLRGIAVIPPEEPDTTFQNAHRLGVRGIRINCLNPAGLTIRDFTRAAMRVRAWGWHIQVQASAKEVIDSADLILGSPVPVVLDHFAFVGSSPECRSALVSLLSSARPGMLFMKLSAPYRIEPSPHRLLTVFARELANLVPEKLLWGLDWPHTECFSSMPDDAKLIDLVEEWLPAPELRRQVLCDNPRRLYWDR